MTDDPERRPIASRETGWARRLTRALASSAVTPNQISMASMIAAALAGGALWGVGQADGASRIALLLLAAAGCQLRLLCNLMDGLVAVEARRGSPDGAFWNEFPDRISDILILVGLGFAVEMPGLGWATASLAVFTAYVRELGHGLGLPSDFRGPMAKPHRMAAVTIASLAAIFDPLWSSDGTALLIGIWVVAIGSAVTVLRRAARIVTRLRGR